VFLINSFHCLWIEAVEMKSNSGKCEFIFYKEKSKLFFIFCLEGRNQAGKKQLLFFILRLPTHASWKEQLLLLVQGTNVYQTSLLQTRTKVS